MKKTILLALSVLLVLGLASMAMALNQGAGLGISGSVHDFTTAPTYGNTSGEICKVCHAPHKADLGTETILWNHDASTIVTYTTYSSSSLTGDTAPQPDGHSKLCLSCHDGTVAIDAFLGDTATSSQMIDDISADFKVGGAGDLSGDHPISIVYNDADAGGLIAKANVSFEYQNLVDVIGSDGKIQCSTCHDVHDQQTEAVGGTSLLRMANTGSALCLACHDKGN